VSVPPAERKSGELAAIGSPDGRSVAATHSWGRAWTRDWIPVVASVRAGLESARPRSARDQRRVGPVVVGALTSASCAGSQKGIEVELDFFLVTTATLCRARVTAT
jgi:hypothetical protein